MSYIEYFRLQQEPFSNAPNAHFYYDSEQHSRALLRLKYAAESMKGLAVLIGDIGAGKTTLARRMLDSLPEDQYEAALLVIIHAGITASWLLKRIALQLGVERPADEKLRILSQIYQRLVKIHESGRKAVVLIDEAQMLDTREIMEEFRGMLNLEIPGHKLVTFVLFGLPELQDNLHLDEPLNQRVAVRCTLSPFSHPEAVRYIDHRLRLAGSEVERVFSTGALQAIHSATGGVPRLINTVCDNVLFEAFVARQEQVKAQLVHAVAGDLGLRGGDAPELTTAPAVSEQPVAAPVALEEARLAAAGGAPAVAAPRPVTEVEAQASDSEGEFDLETALAEPTPISTDAPNEAEADASDEEAAAAFQEIDDFEEDDLDIPRIDALDDIDSILDQLDEKG